MSLLGLCCHCQVLGAISTVALDVCLSDEYIFVFSSISHLLLYPGYISFCDTVNVALQHTLHQSFVKVLGFRNNHQEKELCRGTSTPHH